MHHIDFIHTFFSVPYLQLGIIYTTCMQPRFETEEWALAQSMDKINMLHSRKIFLAESWGRSRFFISRAYFILHFDRF